jgi:hypothetical protein
MTARDRTAAAEVLRLRAVVEVLLDATALDHDDPHPAAILVSQDGDLSFDLVAEFLTYIKNGQSPCDALEAVWATTGHPMPTPPTQE